MTDRSPLADVPDGSPLWVQSLATGAGTYKAAIHLDDRILCWLTVERATRYAATLAAQMAAAGTDAAVLAQLRHILGDAGMPAEDVTQATGMVLKALRAARPEPDPRATAPLTFEPGVSLFTGKPFVHVRLEGKLAWQWDLTDCHDHLMHVLVVAAGTPGDAAYRTALMELVGLDADTATRAVDDLGEYRRRFDDDSSG